MKKRMTAVVLVVAMMTVAANALSIDADATVTAIPEIYVTFIPAEGMDEFENSSFNYVKAYEAELNGETPMTINGVQPTVIKLDAATVVRSEDPILSQVRDRYATLVASGNNITSANIVLPNTGRLSGRNGASICSDGDDDGTDEGGSYWELNSTYWGVYNGYDFRYYLIEDVNNREPDDIYCQWGYVTRMDYETHFMVRYKTSRFLDGAPLYDYDNAVSSIKQLFSDTYQNQTMIFQKAVETYNYVGFDPFFEDIDVRQTTFSFE